MKIFRYNGSNFKIFCDGDSIYKFFPFHKYNESCEVEYSLVGIINYALNWSEIQLEDYLKLLKIKEEING